MKSIKFKVTGTTELMLNNPQTVNPLNEYSKALKEITSKRNKTDEDMEEIFHLKFLSSLYLNKKMQYIIPLNMIEATLIEAAKENKLGKKFAQCVTVEADAILQFPDNGCTPEELYQNHAEKYVDIRSVGIMKAKVPTARAIIPDWSFECTVWFDENQLNDSEICYAFQNAGLRHGVGTYRQRYGRFTVEEIRENKKTKK